MAHSASGSNRRQRRVGKRKAVAVWSAAWVRRPGKPCATGLAAPSCRSASADEEPEVEDFTTVYKRGGSIPDPLGAIAHDDHHGVGAKPAQFPQLGIQASQDRIGVGPDRSPEPAHHRERRPGEISTRSWGSSRTPVLTSWKWPSFAAGRRRQLFRTHPATTFFAHLHPPQAAIHAQNHTPWRLIGRCAGAAAVTVILAQSVAVSLRGFAQPLRHPPHTHRVDLHSQ